MIKKHIIYIIIFWFGVALQAAPHLTRNYAHRYFTTRDGLVQMQVLCAYQDRDGYIWFGTKGGVSRYDGISFKNITQEDGIPVDEMYNICEWGDQKLFFYRYCFQILYENDSLDLIQIPDTLVFTNTKIQSIELNENEILLVNLQKPENKKVNQNIFHFIWNKNTRKFKPWKVIEGTILAYNEQYILASNALYRRKGLRLQKIQSFPNKYDLAQVNWQKGEFYLHNNIDFAIEKYSLRNNHFRFSEILLSNIIQAQFTLLPNNSILYFKNQFDLHVYPKQEVDFGLDIAYTEKIFVDRDGNIWITSNNGLFNFFNLNFEEYTFGLANPDNIWNVIEDNEHNMYFGSYGWGLWQLDTTGNLKAMNQSDPDWLRQYMGSSHSKSGTLYLPSSGGLTVYDKGKFTNLRTGTSLSVYYDESKKQVYYSGYDVKTMKRGLWIGVDNNKKFIPWHIGYPIGLGKDFKGRIRLGSFHGQGYLLGDSIITDTIKRPYKGVVGFAVDKWGRLWKGTTKGIYFELPDGREYRFAPQIKGSISSIYNYHDKYLLMGNGNGISIALLKKDISENPSVWEIGYDDGFTGLDAGQNAFFEDHNGDLWIWTSVNVLKFNPDKLVASRTNITPPIRIKSILYSINNNDWEIAFFSENQEIKLSSDNKFFRIDYIANSISAPKSLRFKYRLIGLSDKWSDITYTKSVNYTNIGYGKYRFEVQCSLDGIHWSDIVRSPEIEITAPFYLHPFAFIVYLILLVVLIILITRVIIWRKQKAKTDAIERQKLENELHLKTLRSKIIPHFTNNVLTAIGHFSMTDKIKAGYYISVFSKFTGLTLANADKNYVNLSDEIEYIQKYLELEKMRFGDKFKFEIEIGNDVSSSTQLPAMTLHTYCDNAIRHGIVNKTGIGKVTIVVTKQSEGVLISISDNGIGRTHANDLGTHGNGKGLKLVEDQINFYNQANEHKMKQTITDLKDNGGSASGTRVDLFIPDGFVFD